MDAINFASQSIVTGMDMRQAAGSAFLAQAASKKLKLAGLLPRPVNDAIWSRYFGY
jgi:hypothetical protein